MKRHNLDDFSRLLKAKRYASGLSLADLAARTGVSRQTLWNIETGKDLWLSTASKIVEHFGGVEAFFGGGA